MKKLLLIGLVAFLLPACTVNGPDTYVVAETFYIIVSPVGDWKTRNSDNDFYIYAEKKPARDYAQCD